MVVRRRGLFRGLKPGPPTPAGAQRPKRHKKKTFIPVLITSVLFFFFHGPAASFHGQPPPQVVAIRSLEPRDNRRPFPWFRYTPVARRLWKLSREIPLE